MTTPAPTQKRTRKPLTAERFVAKMRYLDKTGMERMLAVQAKAANAAGLRFLQREARIRCELLTFVSEDERPAAVKMTNALGIHIDREPPHPPPDEPEESDDVPPMPSHEIDAELDAMDRFDDETLGAPPTELPRGAQPFVESEVSKAARKR